MDGTNRRRPLDATYHCTPFRNKKGCRVLSERRQHDIGNYSYTLKSHFFLDDSRMDCHTCIESISIDYDL